MVGLNKVIITGVSGFIGNHLARYLSNKYHIQGIDKVPWHESFEEDVNIDFYQQDILDEPYYKNDVYAVIHLAAKAGVRESRENFEQYVKDNVLGTKSVLDNCVNYWKPKVLVVASSSSIHGNKSPYAVTKRATEDLVMSYLNCGLLKCWPICARFYTVYGPNQRGGLAIGEFIKNVLQNKPVTIYGDGFQSRDFTFVDDLCRSISDMINAPTFYDHILDIGYGKSHNLYEILHLIGKITGKNIQIEYKPECIYDVRVTKCPDGEYNIANLTSLEDGIRKQIEWQKKEMK